MSDPGLTGFLADIDIFVSPLNLFIFPESIWQGFLRLQIREIDRKLISGKYWYQENWKIFVTIISPVVVPYSSLLSVHLFLETNISDLLKKWCVYLLRHFMNVI